MAEAARFDAWQAGDAYERYMGRWSRAVAPRFVDWLSLPADLNWLDVGCGTGALSASILERAKPNTLVSVDPSGGFIAKAKASLTDARVTFEVGDAQSLPFDPASRDVVVSGLVLNFVPDRDKALAEMRRVSRPGSTIAFYVWDYPGGGLEFLRAFWTVAAELDNEAKNLTEDKRFPFCTAEALVDLARRAELSSIEFSAIEVPTLFRDFDDFWQPFTLGAGPAPGYCLGLSDEARQRLRQRLHDGLPRRSDGAIAMKARAWAVKAKPG
jgi:ubiquinone/menaquinone biosynthesis C-methylase UbiE